MYANGKYVKKVNMKPKTIRYAISKKTRMVIPFLLNVRVDTKK
jgi:hypothetical protein